jgi:hypothetical protein
MPPNKTTGANAGGAPRLHSRVLWAARIAQLIREKMKRFMTIAGFWVLCFVLLFLFYFVADSYVTVGRGLGSWKKSIPLSFGERFVLSFIGATVVTVAVAIITAFAYYLYRATRWLLRKANQ